jgi:hypothetical protein
LSHESLNGAISPTQKLEERFLAALGMTRKRRGTLLGITGKEEKGARAIVDSTQAL